MSHENVAGILFPVVRLSQSQELCRTELSQPQLSATATNVSHGSANHGTASLTADCCVVSLSVMKIKTSEMEFEDHHSDREIIAFVRSNPVLWEKRIKIDKRNRDLISQSFSQIGSLLSIPLTGKKIFVKSHILLGSTLLY